MQRLSHPRRARASISNALRGAHRSRLPYFTGPCCRGAATHKYDVCRLVISPRRDAKIGGSAFRRSALGTLCNF